MRIALLHLPKTGGTTLHNFLVANFPKERICPERFNNFDRFTDEELQAFDLFSAHMDFRNLQRVARPACTITILREPKSRILSLYYYWRAQKDSHIEKHNLVGPRIAKQLNLLDFLHAKGAGIPGNINNVYVRNLIGRHWTGENGELVLSDEDALRVATRNLLTIDMIGFMDALPDLIGRIARRLSVEAPADLPRARSFDGFGKDDPNTEPVEREEITAEIDAGLDELVRLDQRLYNFAKAMFHPAGAVRAPGDTPAGP